MTLTGQGTMWAEFERLFTQLSGLAFRVYDEEGKPLLQKEESPLCSFLLRYRKSRAACEQDCFRQLRSLKDARDIVRNRCHGGLSYRIVPVSIEGRRTAYVLIGKVLTEISGSAEVVQLARLYQLSSDELEKKYLRVRFMTEDDLDRLAGFVRRFAQYLVGPRLQEEDTALPQASLAAINTFGKQLLSFTGTEKEAMVRAVASLAGMLQAEGAALLAGPDAKVLSGLPAAWRLDRVAVARLEALERLEHACDDGEEFVTVVDRDEAKKIGLDSLPEPMWIVKLRCGRNDVGRLVLFGATEIPGPLQELALQLLSTRLHALSLERKNNLEAVERSMLDRLGREIFVAPTVEEILPLALKTAMDSFSARRGSILLASEEDYRVTNCALRGDHESLSGRITHLAPGSVTRKVFTEARPLVMHGGGTLLAGSNDREFPYHSSSFVSVPLRENGTTLGVLHLTDRDQADGFSKDDLSLLDRFGVQASVAIQRARLKSEVEKLQVQALTDWLTGTYNRRHLDATLPKEVKRADRFKYDLAIAFIDIDNFKGCNEELGHVAGDVVLKELTEKISASLREIDSVFRYGGEEFVVILPETGLDGALKAAEEMRKTIEKSSFGSVGDGSGYRLTVSVGVTVFPGTANTSEDLVKKSNLALREAKNLGKNRVVSSAALGGAERV